MGLMKITCELTGAHTNMFVCDMNRHAVYDMVQPDKLIRKDKGFNNGFCN